MVSEGQPTKDDGEAGTSGMIQEKKDKRKEDEGRVSQVQLYSKR